MSLYTLPQTYKSMIDYQVPKNELSIDEICALYQQTQDDTLLATIFVRVYKQALLVYFKKFISSISEEDFCDMLLEGILANVRHFNCDGNVKFITYFTVSLINRCINFMKPKKAVFNNNTVMPCGTLITEPLEETYSLGYIDKLIYGCVCDDDPYAETEFSYSLSSMGLTEGEQKVAYALMDGYTHSEIKRMLSLTNGMFSDIKENLYYKLSHAGLPNFG